ncbi:hypothetical protein C7M84_017333 [Penaeus vannamei]|uniref:Uncharacterized protein n=1 Tax=Penaeus vannamei TaxID=6689 RepID=A0A423SKF7_PENVA|nr:hypothetical protein C7M84_017333 [Penaeus vannamei]
MALCLESPLLSHVPSLLPLFLSPTILPLFPISSHLFPHFLFITPCCTSSPSLSPFSTSSRSLFFIFFCLRHQLARARPRDTQPAGRALLLPQKLRRPCETPARSVSRRGSSTRPLVYTAHPLIHSLVHSPTRLHGSPTYSLARLTHSSTRSSFTYLFACSLAHSPYPLIHSLLIYLFVACSLAHSPYPLIHSLLILPICLLVHVAHSPYPLIHSLPHLPICFACSLAHSPYHSSTRSLIYLFVCTHSPYPLIHSLPLLFVCLFTRHSPYPLIHSLLIYLFVCLFTRHSPYPLIHSLPFTYLLLVTRTIALPITPSLPYCLLVTRPLAYHPTRSLIYLLFACSLAHSPYPLIHSLPHTYLFALFTRPLAFTHSSTAPHFTYLFACHFAHSPYPLIHSLPHVPICLLVHSPTRLTHHPLRSLMYLFVFACSLAPHILFTRLTNTFLPLDPFLPLDGLYVASAYRNCADSSVRFPCPLTSILSSPTPSNPNNPPSPSIPTPILHPPSSTSTSTSPLTFPPHLHPSLSSPPPHPTSILLLLYPRSPSPPSAGSQTTAARHFPSPFVITAPLTGTGVPVFPTCANRCRLSLRSPIYIIYKTLAREPHANHRHYGSAGTTCAKSRASS